MFPKRAHFLKVVVTKKQVPYFCCGKRKPILYVSGHTHKKHEQDLTQREIPITEASKSVFNDLLVKHFFVTKLSFQPFEKAEILIYL